jgi:NTE family protein
MSPKPKLGLALSGGGARGLAHIGVLKTLETSGFQPDYMAGTSMGGVIAAGYAAGLNPDELEQIAREIVPTRNLLRLADPTLPRNGLFQGERLRAFFNKHMQECTFADLRIPLTLIAVDLNTDQEIHLKEGLVADALRATVSVPGLIAPVESAGQKLVDGGLLNNLPVDVVREMGADVVLGVDITTSGNGDPAWQVLTRSRIVPAALEELITILGRSIDLVMSQQVKQKLKECPPDFLLRPAIPANITTLTGFNNVEGLVAAGEETTRTILPDLREALQTPLNQRDPLPAEAN